MTEELEYVLGRFVVKRIVRPRLACGGCERFHQAPLPPRPIERGRSGLGLLAHVPVSEYCDHLPLYRQSRIFARDGVELDRSTLAGWVGKATALLEPLAEAIGRHVLAGQALFADDTPVKLLAPGTGRTATGRAWTYVRDERPWQGEAPPAAWYRFSADRKAAHPKAHVRRKFFDVHAAQGSAIAATPSRKRPAASRPNAAQPSAGPGPRRASTNSSAGCNRSSRRSPPRPRWRRRSGMPRPGSSACGPISSTASWRSTTTRPNAL